MRRPSSRTGIYYWKCDRQAAFHGTAQGEHRRASAGTEAAVRDVLNRFFGQAPDTLVDGGGQGNHLTFAATVGGQEVFVRIEDGPERDDYIDVESAVMDRVRSLGVPAPRVYASDGTRRSAPFAWQILERVPAPDLNRHFKDGRLSIPEVAHPLGRFIATWQQVPVSRFGPFDVDALRADGRLDGLLETYADYYFTQLDRHLAFLVERGLVESAYAMRIAAAIEAHRHLLDLPSPCLVHKDLALWNVLGTERQVLAVIDWDDCVGGDPMDDLSLLGCFHDGAFLREVFAGYASVRPLPEDHAMRFWLHLLRNMIFKAVIRVGAGYFDHDSRFFMIGAGGGASLKAQTLSRLDAALAGLRVGGDPLLI